MKQAKHGWASLSSPSLRPALHVSELMLHFFALHYSFRCAHLHSSFQRDGGPSQTFHSPLTAALMNTLVVAGNDYKSSTFPFFFFFFNRSSTSVYFHLNKFYFFRFQLFCDPNEKNAVIENEVGSPSEEQMTELQSITD